MRNYKRWCLAICTVFLFISCPGIWGQDSTPPDQAKSGLTTAGAAKTEIPAIDPIIEKAIEDRVENIYERKYRDSDKILTSAQWLVTVVIGIVTFIIGLIIFITYRNITDKYKEAIDEIQAMSQVEITKLNKKIDRISQIINELNEKTIKTGNDVIKKIKISQADAYYDIAASSINKGRYELALDFLVELYASKYRLRDVCYHIGICYKNMKEPDYPQAIEFFEMAKQEAEKEGKEGMVTSIQREIDDTRALLQKKDDKKGAES